MWDFKSRMMKLTYRLRGGRGKTMSERELERILAEEPDEAKVCMAIEKYLKEVTT
jgi:hypothetical protein